MNFGACRRIDWPSFVGLCDELAYAASVPETLLCVLLSVFHACTRTHTCLVARRSDKEAKHYDGSR